jgi:hypothetical protein
MVISTRYVKFSQLLIFIQVAVLLLPGCNTLSTKKLETHQESNKKKEALLDPEMMETSGLICRDDGSFLTLNDSGNSPTIYRLNSNGKVLERFLIDAKNQDWEALAIHQGKLWLADIGNNSGARSGGDLYQVSLQLNERQLNQAIKTSFVYPDLPHPPLQMYQHDFDAEAIVSADEQLFLFNKAWQSAHSSVYQLTTENGSTTAQKIATIDGLPGVITDGVYATDQHMFILTGYARFRENMLNMALHDDYRPFLAVVDRNFTLKKLVPVTQGGQLEAICIDQHQQIWLSQEQSKGHQALLWHWGSLQQLIH